MYIRKPPYLAMALLSTSSKEVMAAGCDVIICFLTTVIGNCHSSSYPKTGAGESNSCSIDGEVVAISMTDFEKVSALLIPLLQDSHYITNEYCTPYLTKHNLVPADSLLSSINWARCFSRQVSVGTDVVPTTIHRKTKYTY